MRLHRHQLLRLHDSGWRRALARDWDEEARACLAHWAEHRLPLVVTRQPEGWADGVIAVGLPAPAVWSRRRLVLRVARSDVVAFDEFPRPAAVTAQIPASARAPWRALCAELEAAAVDTRVYGSHGWQFLSGLRYLHRDSDIDLYVSVDRASRAEVAVAALGRFQAAERPRLDGELVFNDGTACAWREWQAWRDGRCAHVLFKSLTGPSLVSGACAFGDKFEGATP